MKFIYVLVASFAISSSLAAQSSAKKINNFLLNKKIPFNGTALIAYKGNVLLHKGYGFKNVLANTLNDTTTIYRIGSLSKSFTATLVMHLAELHQLNLHDPLSLFLPDFPNASKITIENLLTHSSGVRDYLEVKAVQELPDSAPPISIDRLIAYFSGEPTTMYPGEKFAYSNSNYILLAAVVEKLTNRAFEHVVRDSLFTPLNMNHSGFDFKHLPDTNKATGHFNIAKRKVLTEDFDSTYAPGCGSMYTTTSDVYRFYQSLQSGKMLSDTTKSSAFKARQWKYGYGWFVQQLYGTTAISHAGGVPGFLANLQFYPKEDLCIVLLSNSNEDDIIVTSDKIAAIVLGKHYQRSGL